jgi:F0F1-type ATP synthase membrane subunit b/b'
MKKQHIAIATMPLALFIAGIAVTSSTLNAADVPDSEQVNQLLSDAKTQAFQLREDASTMESYTRSSASWQAHAVTVTQMKEHVNAAGRTLTKLQDARKTASPWQATAIDRVQPLLKEIASNTQSVIEYLNKNPQRLAMTEYKDYIETNSDEASDLAGLIADFVNYGNTKSRLERLTSKLELPGK